LAYFPSLSEEIYSLEESRDKLSSLEGMNLGKAKEQVWEATVHPCHIMCSLHKNCLRFGP